MSCGYRYFVINGIQGSAQQGFAAAEHRRLPKLRYMSGGKETGREANACSPLSTG